MLRSLGLRLDTIAEVLADRTIQSLKEEATMDPDKMFDGLIEDPYESRARGRWGDEAIDESHRRIHGLSREDRELLTSGRGFKDVHTRLAQFKEQGLPVDDPRVQAAIGRHYEVVSLAWTPSAEAYVALGQMYLGDERFRKNIGQGDDALVTYLAEGMKVYAADKLSP